MKVPSSSFDGLSLDVFGHDVSGLALANDATLLRPKVDCNTSPMVCTREGLTGEGSINDIDEPVPGLSFEFTHVRKDWKPWEATVLDPLLQDGLAVLSDFDGADGAVSEQDVGK